MHGMQKPDANKFADRLIQKFDKDGDRALSAEELGKMSSFGKGKMMPMRSVFGMRSMYGMRNMYGMGCMHSRQKPDINELGDRIIQRRDKDGNGALTLDELGKLSERLRLVEADFDEDGLIDREKLISRISEKLEGIGKESADEVAETQGISDTEPTDVVAETQNISDTKPADVVAEAPSISDTGSADVVAEAQSISDLVQQLLSQLDLSKEQTESFLETMKNYGINITA
jgi:hypothetical protein